MWSTFRPAVAGALRVARGASTANRLTFAVSRAHVFRSTPTKFAFNNQVRYLAAAAQAKPTKKAAPKKTPAAKKAPAKKKPAAKKVVPKKKKPVVKKKVVKKRVVKKKVLTPEQKKNAKIMADRITSLRREEPKQLPSSAWLVFTEQNIRGQHGTASEQAKNLSPLFKALSTPEHQALQEIADKNRIANQATLKAWVLSYTPTQIREANLARARLAKLANKKSSHKIVDDRIPKRPTSSYFIFYKGRYNGSSGPVFEQVKQAAQEWNKMSAAERKPYEDLNQQERVQYAKAKAAVGLTAA